MKKELPKISFKKISMQFGDFYANKNISFDVKENEVHALLGENGAGKSTLMSILFGLYNATEGEIHIDGINANIKNPKIASDKGIAMLPQHFKLVDNISGWENIVLGHEQTYIGMGVKKRLSLKLLEEVKAKYNIQIDLKKKVNKLSVSDKQKVELLKMLWRDNDILIFDEPTSILTPQEIESFLKIIKDLKKAGKTIIIITHKLDEIKKIADNCSILRKGKLVKTVDVKKTSKEKLVEHMVGKAVDLDLGTISKKAVKTQEVKLSIKELNINTHSKSTSLKDISFDVNAGEIVGIAAIDGNGQTELFEAIGGLRKYNGSIFVDNHDLSKLSVKQRYSFKQKGVETTSLLSHIPEDRHEHGLFLNTTPALNSVSQRIDQFKIPYIGITKNAKINKYFAKLEKEYDIRGVISKKTIARDLSGGNQQKLIIARELDRDSSLILAVHPTRGLDMGAIRNIYTKLIEKRNNGAAVLFFSGEMDEIMQVSDRILVLTEGKIVGEFSAKKANRNVLGQLMAEGVKDE